MLEGLWNFLWPSTSTTTAEAAAPAVAAGDDATDSTTSVSNKKRTITQVEEELDGLLEQVKAKRKELRDLKKTTSAKRAKRDEDEEQPQEEQPQQQQQQQQLQPQPDDIDADDHDHDEDNNNNNNNNNNSSKSNDIEISSVKVAVTSNSAELQQWADRVHSSFAHIRRMRDRAVTIVLLDHKRFNDLKETLNIDRFLLPVLEASGASFSFDRFAFGTASPGNYLPTSSSQAAAQFLIDYTSNRVLASKDCYLYCIPHPVWSEVFQLVEAGVDDDAKEEHMQELKELLSDNDDEGGLLDRMEHEIGPLKCNGRSWTTPVLKEVIELILEAVHKPQKSQRRQKGGRGKYSL